MKSFYILQGPFTNAVPSLRTGDNVLAVELHQSATNSSDIVLGAELLSGSGGVVGRHRGGERGAARCAGI